MWESMPAMPTVIEHNEDGSVASTASSFTPTFGNPVDAGLDPSSFGKSVDGPVVVSGDDGSPLNPAEVVYRWDETDSVCMIVSSAPTESILYWRFLHCRFGNITDA